jgi:hypothetical protein
MAMSVNDKIANIQVDVSYYLWSSLCERGLLIFIATFEISPAPILLKSLLSLSLFYLSTTSHPHTFLPPSIIDHSSPTSAPSSDRSDPSTVRSGGSLETDGSFVHVPSGTDKDKNGSGRRSMAEFREKDVGDVERKEKERHSVDTPRYSSHTIQGSVQQMKIGDSVDYLSNRDLDGDDDEVSALREGREWWVGVASERRDEVEGELENVEGVLKSKLGTTERRVSATWILSS